MNEYQTQVMIFNWAALAKGKYPELELLNSSLNGVRLTIGQAVKAKKAGMKKGYPDIFLPVKRSNYSGLYIEQKIKGNKPSPEQVKWLKDLTDQGFKCEVSYSFDQTISYIEEYLKYAA